MTIVAVLADPPEEGHVLPDLVETSPLSAADAAELYEALFRDTVSAVERSAGSLLVNYAPAADLPDGVGDDTPPEAQLRTLVVDEVDDPEFRDSVRFEPQVGSSVSARAGNTATHLLREEGASSVAIVRPTVPFLFRTVLDAASMKLRQSGAVLGPAPGGRVYYAGFREPIDFADAWEPPALSTLANRAVDAELDVDFVEMQPTIETGRDLAAVLIQLRARVDSERIVPVNTATVLSNLDVDLAIENGEPTLVST